MNILISTCLLDLPCRYDGTGFPISEELKQLMISHTLIPVCPEQLGGLSTPRSPVEIQDGKAVTKDDVKVTEQFKRGAEAVLSIAKLNNCKYAVLKEKSPSCGSNMVYDGTFTASKIKGQGFTAKCLMDHGLIIYNEDQVNELRKQLSEQR